ncbi:hypothetical protein [Sporofaciens sp. JLR.KK001]|jgi:hypothetical protein|uniref:hypothetical protein n=1 Tax=Sporofaciens sp. JLR.KK001 TaxID=3112621 RepID=UPI002FF01FA8
MAILAVSLMADCANIARHLFSLAASRAFSCSNLSGRGVSNAFTLRLVGMVSTTSPENVSTTDSMLGYFIGIPPCDMILEERLHRLFIAGVIERIGNLTFGHKNIRKVFDKTEMGHKYKLEGIKKGRYETSFVKGSRKIYSF